MSTPDTIITYNPHLFELEADLEELAGEWRNEFDIEAAAGWMAERLPITQAENGNEIADLGMEALRLHELPRLTDADATELAGKVAGEVDSTSINGATVTLWDRRVAVYPAGHEFRIEFQRMTDEMWGRWEDCRDDEHHGRGDVDEAAEAAAEFLRGVIRVHGEFYAVDRLSLGLDECGHDEKPYEVVLASAAQAWLEAGDEDEDEDRESLIHEAAEEAFMSAARERRDEIAAHVRLYTGGQALNSAQWNSNSLPDCREVETEEREHQERELWDELAHQARVIEIDLDGDGELVATTV